MAKQIPEIMTINDLRKYIRTSFPNAKKLVTDGKIPGNKINERGDIRVRKADVDEWLKSGGAAI
jgi:excisionase family DNA binding protein